MNIEVFKTEEWMNKFENDAKYNLGETCVDSITLRELFELAGVDADKYLNKIADTRMTYSHIYGSPELLKGIASLYKTIEPSMVVPAHGAIGANYQIVASLVDRGDNVVSFIPTYQVHYSVSEAVGAEVRYLRLRKENEYLPDLDELRELVDENTKIITINNPNNPTGALIPKETLIEIAKIASEAGAYVLSDEVYLGISEDDSSIPLMADLYEKGISIGSMSKVFSLAGLRMGWIATRDEAVIKEVYKHRDYNTISCGVLDDMISALALANKDKIFARNKKILLHNREILDKWVNETPGVEYVRPKAGTTALVYYNKDMPSYDLCKKLLKEEGVLFTPGSCFEMEGAVRIGYAFDPEVLEEGLSRFAAFLKRI